MKTYSLLPLAALASMAALPNPAVAGTSDSQVWTTATVNAKLTDKLKFQNELVLRFSDDKNGLYEIENSALLGYQLNDHVSAWAGYVHDPNYVGGDFTVMERRAREQLVFDNIAAIGKAKLSARTRFEQRWRDHVEGTGWRFRPYVKLAMPLGGKTAPSLTLSHEEFINLNETTFQKQGGFERMRNAVSLSLPLSSALKADVGYLNQYRANRNAPDTMDHVLTAGIGLSF